MSKGLLLLPRGQTKERFVIVNHDWLIPVQSLRRLTGGHTVEQLENLIFPPDESFESHWQLYIEHQSNSGRLRIGLALLAPRDRCLRADIKLILVTTHGGQIIKEHFFHDHTFFLSKGEAINSYINEHISPKVFLDITDDLYQNVVNAGEGENLLNTDDCTIFAYVRFINEYEIEPKTKAFDFSRRLTVDWKLTKFRHIIEQINQSRPPVENNRRLVSDRFQFTHVKITEGLKTTKWKLTIHYPQTSPPNKQTPFFLTLQSSNTSKANHGKFEIICKNEHNVLRRYSDSMEDLSESYPIEFFTLDELSANIYKYKQNFNENDGRFVIIDYLLLSIRVVQPFQTSDILKKVKRVAEPTIISLNNAGNVRQKKAAEEKRTKSMVTQKKAADSPGRTTSQGESFPPNPVFPPIRVPNISPTRLRSSSSLRTLPNIGEKLTRSLMSRPAPIRKQPSTIPSASTTNSRDSTDNFTFLANLFRSGLHSDITIHYHDQQWNLHKSILSARSLYFNQYFAASKRSELTLSEDQEPVPAAILEKMFLFLYTNQYTSDKHTRLLLQSSMKYGIDTLTQLCLQDMLNPPNLNVNTAASLLTVLHQAMTDPYTKFHSKEYLTQIRTCKQMVLRFIQLHSREVLLSSSWKVLEKQYPTLVHDVLEFVVFE